VIEIGHGILLLWLDATSVHTCRTDLKGRRGSRSGIPRPMGQHAGAGGIRSLSTRMLADQSSPATLSDMTAAGRPRRTGVWVDARLRVHESAIEGRGLFAMADIDAGTTVIRLGGRLVSTAELEHLFQVADSDPSAPYVDTITVDEDVHLVLPSGTAGHFANHSCDPNLWHVGPYEIATRRHIRCDEEVTIDYATHSGAPGFSMTCACGSTLCRGVVESDDWQRPELQLRYRGHWVPALQRFIDARSGHAPE
jgi:uncharacterized protein